MNNNFNEFDLVIGNPPYNSPGSTATGNMIWHKFVDKSLTTWIKSNGYLLYVHPAGWRKPGSDKSKFVRMFDLMTKQNQMLYLEIHDTKDGQKTFKCGTRYDFYLIKHCSQYKETVVKDEKGITNSIVSTEWQWLPNYNFLNIRNILGNGCKIIYNRSNYGSDKIYVSHNQSDIFKYPLIHSTPQKGTRYMYSSKNDLGHFGVSKVIFGDTGIYDVIFDMEGKYGMTQHSMAIEVANLVDAKNIKKALMSEKFKEILKSCLFSNYQTDWRLFKYFKSDFYLDFI